MPAASANALSGVGVRIPFLPTGLSGCVRTAATEKPSSNNALRGATENSGAPAYMIFMDVLFPASAMTALRTMFFDSNNFLRPPRRLSFADETKGIFARGAGFD